MGRKKGGGGKLNRSEIIQARLDPKIHMAAEIMARSERRTLSSFIEKSIEQAAKTNKIKRNLFHPWWSQWPSLNFYEKIYSKFDMVTIEEAVTDVLADHEAIRFFKFAMSFPALLNKAEEEMFNIIISTDYFWMHYLVAYENEWGQFKEHEWMRMSAFEGLIQENLIEYWEKIKSQKITRQELAKLPRGKELNAPLRSDQYAIEKIVETGDEIEPYELIFAWDKEKFELSPEDIFWKKNAKKLVTQKIEVKQTDHGPQIITTSYLPKDDSELSKLWIDFCNKKMEEINNGD